MIHLCFSICCVIVSFIFSLWYNPSTFQFDWISLAQKEQKKDEQARKGKLLKWKRDFSSLFFLLTHHITEHFVCTWWDVFHLSSNARHSAWYRYSLLKHKVLKTRIWDMKCVAGRRATSNWWAQWEDEENFPTFHRLAFPYYKSSTFHSPSSPYFSWDVTRQSHSFKVTHSFTLSA